MKRPAKVPASAEFDADSGFWVTVENTFDSDGYEYEVEKCYNDDGRLISIIEMEV